MGLVLSRRKGQKIFIKRGERLIAEIEITKITGRNTVYLHIDADEELFITRDLEINDKRMDQEVPLYGIRD